MAKPLPFNAASRCHHLLSIASKQDGNRSILNAWTAVFGKASYTEQRQSIYVATMLGLLVDQLDDVLLQMTFTTYSERNYEPVIEQLHRTLDVKVFPNPWSEFSRFLDQYALGMLWMFAETIPSEGESIDLGELRSMEEQLDELRASVLASNMSDEAKRFFVAQINTLLVAVREYPVRGGEVFSEAFTQTVTRYGLKFDLIKAQEEDPEFQQHWERFTQAWKWVKERSNDVETVTKLYGGYKALEQGAHWVGLLT